MKKIKFTAQGANALIGGFGPGDVANVGEELAKHLVEEAGVACYMESSVPAKAAKSVDTAKAGKSAEAKSKVKAGIQQVSGSAGDPAENAAGT